MLSTFVFAIKRDTQTANMVIKIIFGIFFLASFVQGDEEVSQEKWGDFKIKWKMPGTKFINQPQTKDDSILKASFWKVDICRNKKENRKSSKYCLPTENLVAFGVYFVMLLEFILLNWTTMIFYSYVKLKGKAREIGRRFFFIKILLKLADLSRNITYTLKVLIGSV